MEEIISKNYTLEKHLKSLAEADKDYELLYSIWDLNKKNLSQGLNIVSSSYPNFSLHDVSHSMTIINNIQCLLGEERIKRLGATDTFLLLMACLTHDIGMILTYKIIEKEWDKENIEKILTNLSANKDKVVSESAKLILQFHNNKEKPTGYKWALEVKNAVIIITTELLRGKHAEISADYLTADSEFRKLAENFHSEQLPNRFMELLANVAYLHGEGFEDVMNRLYYQADGFKGDYTHPRFIACMIRLGDLLDFDSNRFSFYANATIKEMPDISKYHQQKHASVKHKLISPTAIEAELVCSEENVYRVAREWFDMLEAEVSNQSREWTNLSPSDLGGLPPVISRDSIKIRYNGISLKPELLNLKFTMSQKKIFSILQGGGIYKEPGFAFIREIVQNAFDASKMQMWKDIKAGVYDYFFDKNKIDKNKISFPDEIDPLIYNQYPVELSIKWKDDKKDVLRFECVDYGTGISEATLMRMTQQVGESHVNDPDYDANMPYWLKPTAVFGVGLQSIFFVTSMFEVETSYPGETSKRIIFRSAAENQYSSISAVDISRKRGTTVRVDISKDSFEELFGTTFSWDILDKTDVFKGNGDDVYLAKIDDFVYKTFENVNNVCFKYKPEIEERGFEIAFNNTDCDNKCNIDGDFKYDCAIKDGLMVFCFYEKKYGSTFKMWFSDKYNHFRFNNKLLLRDVLVANAKLDYIKTAYMGFVWNLQNQTTDKIVDISRDNLTHNGRQLVTRTLLDDLLPDFLRLIKDSFQKEMVKRNRPASLNIQYLNYCLTAMACNIDMPDVSLIKNVKLPDDMVSFNKKEMSVEKFFTATTLYLVDGFRTNGYNVIIKEDKEKILDENKSLLNRVIVLWGNHYLSYALRYNYICTEVLKYEHACHIYKLEKKDIKKCSPMLVECNDSSKYLNRLAVNSHYTCSRTCIYGLKKYARIVVKPNYISGFENFPEYSSCIIYSPFSSKKQVEELLLYAKDKTDAEIKSYINDKLKEYITPYMIEVIKKDNVNSDVKEKDINDEYTNLIFDFVKSHKKD